MKAVVITISDRGWRGETTDTSGPALVDMLVDGGWQVQGPRLLPDRIEAIRQAVTGAAEEGFDLVVTTGGTGIAPRDLTPEAVRPLLDKEIPGWGELMRLRGLETTLHASLSRSLAGVCGSALVICVPGSRNGACDSLGAVIELLPHALEVLSGGKSHPT